MNNGFDMQRLEVEFRKLGQQISGLESEADRAITRVKGGALTLYARLAECEEKQRLLRSRIDVLSRQRGQAAQEIAAALDAAWRDARDAYERARVALP